MRTIPAIRYIHRDGREQIIECASEAQARRYIGICCDPLPPHYERPSRADFMDLVWIQKPSLWDRLRGNR